MSSRLEGPRPGSFLLHATLLCGALLLSQQASFQQGWAALATVNPWLLLTGGLWLLAILSSWPAIGLTWLLDHKRGPRWLYRTKIQADRARPWQPTDREVVRLSLLNHLIFLPPTLLALQVALQARGWRFETTLPGAGEVLLDLVLLTLVTDLLFYLGHRALHRPWWMTHIHGAHHRFTASTGMASLYQHPVEFVLTGVAPLGLAALIVLPHAFTIAIFAVLGTLNVVITHSGYNLPFATWAGFHDLHHARVRGNFGVTGAVDWLLGTWLPLEDRKTAEKLR